MKKLILLIGLFLGFQFCAFGQDIPLPGRTKSKPKPRPTQPRDNTRPTAEPDTDKVVERDTARNNDLSSLYTESERIQHETALHKSVVNALKRSIYIVRQDYVLEDDNGDQVTKTGLEYFGREYGIVVAADQKLWGLTANISPWVEDPKYRKYKGTHTPLRSRVALRNIEERDFRYVNMISEVDESDQIGFYLNDEITNYTTTTLNKSRTEGRLVLFYVNQGEDEEVARIKWRVQNVDPEWQANLGQVSRIRNKSAKLLGGMYFVEEYYEPLDKVNTTTVSRSRGKKKKGEEEEVSTTSSLPLGVVQYKLVGLYKEIENRSYVIALPPEMIAQTTITDSKKSSKKKRGGRRGSRRGSRN